jgi:two-component system sensor histidine kinase/response regulator
MRMPVLDGYAATRRIRELEGELSRPRTPIIALTASAFEHDRPEILSAGCDAIIAKPFRESVLLEAVARSTGARYVYEEAPPDPAGPTTLGARLDAADRAALHAALSRGDDLAAQEAALRLAERDPWAAAEVTRMLKAFQLDELMALLEGEAP